MKEQLIQFNTAKLAKDKGFDWKCLGNYHIGRINGKKHIPQIGMYYHDWNNRLEPNRTGYEGKKPNQGQSTTSAPTQSLLQKWLRDEHKLHVEIIAQGIHELKSYAFQICNIGNTNPYPWYFKPNNNYDEGFNTYEEALEAGLIEALNLTTP